MISRAKWFDANTEGELGSLTHLCGIFWQDEKGRFYFNDEVQCDVCGPFDTLLEADRAAVTYAEEL